jgi:quinol monooxygenase YgiN
MQPGCTVVSSLLAKPDKREEVLKIFQDFVEPSRSDPACLGYHLHVSETDPNLFVFYENWRNRKDLNAHLELPMLTGFLERRSELLQKEIETQFLQMLTRF